jgi:hypothetical protein
MPIASFVAGAAFVVLTTIVAMVLALARRRRSAGLRYDLAGDLGFGDLCDVHAAVHAQDRFILKIARVNGLDHLLAKEFALLEDLQERAKSTVYRNYLPEPVETQEREGRRTNVFRWREGYRTAEEIRKRYPRGLDGRHVAWMFNRTLEVLGFVHRAGWVHGAVLPPHLLFHPEDHGLRLIDWIHAERLNETIRFVPDRFADWYPIECRGRKPASPSTDLYLAAKSMIYLAGGDPASGDIPKSVPAEIRRFLEACLLESPSMRCQDAWQLRDDFARVLEGVYGPPKFVPLVMT